MAGVFLTEDILIYIFIYLPLISICKFKSFSKVWLSIFSDPYFITKWFQLNINEPLPGIHYQTSMNRNGFKQLHPLKLGNYACPGLHSKSISGLFDHGFCFRFLTKQIRGLELGFIGSSNGLVLCYTTVRRTRRYYVCNPLTQKFVFIPSPPNPVRCYLGVIGFFCEYSSPYTTSCYKVVRITSLEEEVWAYIFCSKLGEWKTFQVSCPVNVLNERYLCVYDNDVTRDSVLYWINKGHKLIAYNLNNFRTDGHHQCRVIELPDDYGANHKDRILGESEGLICYARITRSQRTLSVWVLKDENWLSLCNGVKLQKILAAMRLRKGNANSMFGSAEVLVQVVGFNPVDHDVVLLGCWNYTWEFNIRTRRFKEPCCPSLFLSNSTSEDDYMHTPFVLKPMPTIIPPPSWIET